MPLLPHPRFPSRRLVIGGLIFVVAFLLSWIAVVYTLVHYALKYW